MSERIIPVALSDKQSMAPAKLVSRQVISKIRCKGRTIEIYK